MTGNMSGSSVMVPLARIPTDGAGQTRAEVRPGVVKEYAAAMKEQVAEGGTRFPPVILFADGNDYWLADGFHRVLAAAQAGLTEIAAEVHPGSRRDALLFGIGANGEHGLPRSNEDKRRAVALLLADPEWNAWNDREIARHCRVAHSLVSRMRRASVLRAQMRKVQRGDKVYEMKVNSGAADSEAAACLPAPAGAAVTDPLGIPLPEPMAKIFAALGEFHKAHELMDRLAELLDRIAQGPAGELYRREMLRTDAGGQVRFACTLLRACRAKLRAAQPYCCCCPNCRATHPTRPYPDCKTCRGLGWTTQAAFEACRQSDRQSVLAGRHRE